MRNSEGAPADPVRPGDVTPCQAALVLAQLPAAVVMANASGEVMLANARAQSILGQTALVGRNLLDVFPIQWPGGGEAALETKSECTIQTAREGLRVLGYRARVIPAPPGFPPGAAAVVVVFQDVTSHQAVRTERDRLLQVATVGQVLPSLLHELKNPLASVNTAVELLLEELMDHPAQAQLHGILGELRRVRLSMEGIGTLGRSIRSTRAQVVDLPVRESFRILEAQAQSRGIITRMNVKNLPLLKLEAGPLRALVFNLVSNAIQACSRDHTISLSMELSADGEVLELRVEDTGKGMAPDVLARCTELFFTTRQNGSGIGLALVKRTVEDALGTLTVHSQPGAGTQVCVRIPVEGPSAATLPSQRAFPQVNHVPR